MSRTNPCRIVTFLTLLKWMVVTKTRGETFSRKQLTHEKFIGEKMMLLAPDVEQPFGPDWQQWRWIIQCVLFQLLIFGSIVLIQYLFLVLKWNWWFLLQVCSRGSFFFRIFPWFWCILAHLDGGWSLTSESRRLTFVMHGTQYKCLATSLAYSKIPRKHESSIRVGPIPF